MSVFLKYSRDITKAKRNLFASYSLQRAHSFEVIRIYDEYFSNGSKGE